MTSRSLESRNCEIILVVVVVVVVLKFTWIVFGEFLLVAFFKKILCFECEFCGIGSFPKCRN